MPELRDIVASHCPLLGLNVYIEQKAREDSQEVCANMILEKTRGVCQLRVVKNDCEVSSLKGITV